MSWVAWISRLGITKNVATLVLIRGVAVISQIVLVKLVSNNFSTENLGHLYLIQSIYIGLQSIFLTPIELYRNTRIQDAIGEGKAIFENIKYDLTVISILFIFGLITALFLNNNEVYSISQYIFLIAILCIFNHIFSQFKSAVTFGKNSIVAGFLVSGELLTRATLLLIFLYLFNKNISTVLICYSISCLIFVIISYRIIILEKWKIYDKDRAQVTKKTRQFIYPIIVASLMGWIQSQVLIRGWAVTDKASEIGIFVTVSALGQAIAGIAYSIYQQKNIQELYKYKAAHLDKYINNGSVIILILFVGWILLGNFLVKVVTSDFFAKYWIFGFFGMLFEYAMFIIGSINIYFHFENNNKFIMIGSLISFISAIAITIFSIVFKDVNYAIYSTVLILPPIINIIYLFYIRKFKLKSINA